ncbi:hypothetical protein J4E85_002214 [Alternaria conjuncta]|uniref:uncharacterized protein n=1 Tax=Alternaria conjuncta TaxID=181017 RepID=UPI00222028EE|nr:uncharacterized protein J4E85_002214 [Alternaria conjuncta]KAI4934358.1 hypothetical protein J4E85_002214 [Alternaria conjuncta]
MSYAEGSMYAWRGEYARDIATNELQEVKIKLEAIVFIVSLINFQRCATPIFFERNNKAFQRW